MMEVKPLTYQRVRSILNAGGHRQAVSRKSRIKGLLDWTSGHYVTRMETGEIRVDYMSSYHPSMSHVNFAIRGYQKTLEAHGLKTRLWGSSGLIVSLNTESRLHANL